MERSRKDQIQRNKDWLPRETHVDVRATSIVAVHEPYRLAFLDDCSKGIIPGLKRHRNIQETP